MRSSQDPPVIAFASQVKWKTWLAANHAVSAGLWVKIAKKEAGIATVKLRRSSHRCAPLRLDRRPEEILRRPTLAAAIHAADGNQPLVEDQLRQGARLDRERAEQAAGLKEVERARKDGRWDAAYEAQSVAQVPDDLQRALDKQPAAKAFFATLDGRNRYAILYRIAAAKKLETRAQRIKTFIAMLAENEKIHP
jgi:uncharacterized protein YdeI (YjbR/CyaY-like superfamily)